MCLRNCNLPFVFLCSLHLKYYSLSARSLMFVCSSSEGFVLLTWPCDHWNACVCVYECVTKPLSSWKLQVPIPSWWVKTLVLQDVREGKGTRKRRRRRKRRASVKFWWGPHPLGESPAVYPHVAPVPPGSSRKPGCFQDSAAKVSWNSSAQRHMLGSLLREISFLGKLKQRNFLCGQTELPDLKVSWKGNSFIMKWQIKDIPAGFTSKQLLRVQAKPYYTPSQNKNKSHPDRFLYAGLYPSPTPSFTASFILPSSSLPRH